MNNRNYQLNECKKVLNNIKNPRARRLVENRTQTLDEWSLFGKKKDGDSSNKEGDSIWTALVIDPSKSSEENADAIVKFTKNNINTICKQTEKYVAALVKAVSNLGKDSKKGIETIYGACTRSLSEFVENIPQCVAVVTSFVGAVYALSKRGVAAAGSALTKLYEQLVKYATAVYKSAVSFAKDKKDNITESCKNGVIAKFIAIASALFVLAARGLFGVTAAVKDFITTVVKDAANGGVAAAMAIVSFIKSKLSDAAKFIGKISSKAYETAVNTWKKFTRSIQEGLLNAVTAIDGWGERFAISFQEKLDNALDAIGDAVDKVTDFVVDKKDKALIWNIQKSVKGLSDNYDEEQIVAIVRKALEEGFVFNNRSLVLVESKYSKPAYKRYSLNS